ncbi:MAG: RluA family pseudouridine synthase [Dysgonamonadaceae bacterium]|jgi:23S rRNA pseudouridine1911/1915/1917 synthase|nr:RluA family pseudouridine synthase [Dysgonamonadaceae bacterium]
MEDFVTDIEGREEDAGFIEEQEDAFYEHFRFAADKGQSLLRVDRFLVDRIEHASRNRIQLAACAGFIHVNGKAVRSNYRVKPNDLISIIMDRPRREMEIIPEDIPLHIVYEDDDVIVIDKPPGLVVHPGHGNYTGTLLNALAWYSKDKPGFDTSDPRLGMVHRIDKNTSGLLVIAKNPTSKTHLSGQFFRKTTQRKYMALVWGNVKEDGGRIEGNIGRNLRNKLQMMVFPDGEGGRNAVTHYRVLERFGYVTLIECRLETGRTHQIRVHLKHIGHTLFNDERYGGNEILRGNHTTKYKQFILNCFEICPRQALHAQTLGFVHPKTGKEMFFESPLPEDMKELIEKFKGL